MQIATAYFGTDKLLQSVKDIEIEQKGFYQPYGPAIYLQLDKQEASYDGKYIFEVKFDAANIYTGEYYFDVETNGSFGQFIDTIAQYPEEFMPKETLNDDALSDDAFRYAVNRFLDENEEKYLSEYHAEQKAIREDLEAKYDGVFDGSEYAIYFPEKIILELKLIGERSY